MIKDLLKKENIKMLDHALEWEDAIRYCVQPLVDCHCVEARYAEEIIANTLKMGPYYVIAKNLALIHGRSRRHCKTACDHPFQRSNHLFKGKESQTVGGACGGGQRITHRCVEQAG